MIECSKEIMSREAKGLKRGKRSVLHVRYLFFDIECSDGVHICEFGYVITDEKFEILEQKVITVNPESAFNLDVERISLYYPNEIYEASPTFPHYYEEIKALITAPDQIVMGHAIHNDAKFIRTACEKYDLAPIDFTFYDSQEMFNEYTNSDRSFSLSDAGAALEIKKPEYLHRSDVDSRATMELVRAMCGKMNATLPEMLELCPYCMGRMVDHIITKEGEKKKWKDALAMLEDGSIGKKKAEDLIGRFAGRVEPSGESNNVLNGKQICFLRAYEITYPQKAMAFVQAICDRGGKYTRSGATCQYFVCCPELAEEAKEDGRLKKMKQSKRNGAVIELIDESRLLDILCLTEEELLKIPLPSLEILMKTLEKREKAPKTYSIGDGAPTSLGAALMKKKGIDLSKLFTE